MNWYPRIFLLLYLLFQQLSLLGFIQPAGIFADNMVLQREIKIPVWGKANPAEKITVVLGQEKVSDIAGPEGKWMVYLPSFSAGGPYQLEIRSLNDTIIYKNVLVGEVWFASGQSNMEHPMQGWSFIPHSEIKNYKKEIKHASFPRIRLFDVPKYPAPLLLPDLIRGKWDMADSASVTNFSAMAWFFAKKLYQKLDVPIGIIHSSWGGTSIRTWMSLQSLQPYKEALGIPIRPVEQPFDQEKWTKKVDSSLQDFQVRRKQISYPPPNLVDRIIRGKDDLGNWEMVDDLTDRKYGNVLWMRREIKIPDHVKRPLVVSLGYLDRQAQVYFNQQKMGYFQYPEPVRFTLPENLIKARNTLVIRLVHPGKHTGILGKTADFQVSTIDHSYQQSLIQEWQLNQNLENIYSGHENYQRNPAFLFNGMVAPIIPYGIKGFIWYQGESDVSRPELYEKMFQDMIMDWRSRWNDLDLPFIFVQLANLERTHHFNKKDDSWSLLREAQQKALNLPKTGMVVSLDIGDSLDIHPPDKQEFGQRLALKALAIAYDQPDMTAGPELKGYQVKEDTLIMHFDQVNRLRFNQSKPGCSFELAGQDRIFHTPRALLKDNSVYLFAPAVKRPIAVRYAWDNNPVLCLFDQQGFPAPPFRQDIKVD